MIIKLKKWIKEDKINFNKLILIILKSIDNLLKNLVLLVSKMIKREKITITYYPFSYHCQKKFYKIYISVV